MPEVARCRICGRTLRSPISVARGIGPICANRVRDLMERTLERLRAGTGVEPSDEYYQSLAAMSPEELRLHHEELARRALAERLRNRRPTREPVTVHIPSRTRGLEAEATTVTWIDAHSAHVHSEGSTETYVTSEHGCTCPDFTFRRSRNPELAAEGCRHMQALRLAREEVRRQRSERARRRANDGNNAVQGGNEQPARARVTFAQIDWTEDAQREAVLAIWDEERRWDGVVISQDDRAWQALLEEARGEWEYRYENVLGGTGNTFGLEIEVEFENSSGRRAALEKLYELGITDTLYAQRYHNPDRTPGMWTPEHDGSLDYNGVEFVSPVLRDEPETWQKLETLLQVIREHGGRTSRRTGGHIHIGIPPVDHRTKLWQNLGRVAAAFEHQFYAMGGADSEKYRREGLRGQHRGVWNEAHYARPLYLSRFTGDEIERVLHGDRASLESVINLISYDRYRIFNATNSLRRPTIEFRYPNSSLDHRQWQAQIIVANAIVHQAARPHNMPPGAIPAYSESEKRLRYRRARVEQALLNNRQFLEAPDAQELKQKEEQNFRLFLDFLAHPLNRLAAAWLWERGRIYDSREVLARR